MMAKPATPSKKPATQAPAEGERRAQRGYTRQYESAAAAIYGGLQRGDLRWIGLADRQAGIADDIVLGYDNEVIGHQFKTSRVPGTFRIRTLLCGASGLLPGLARAWTEIKATCPGQAVRIRLVVSDAPANNDQVCDHAGSSQNFIDHWQRHPTWSLSDWLRSCWRPLIADLLSASELAKSDFDEFLSGLELIHGDQSVFASRFQITEKTQPQVHRIAQRLPILIARVPEKDRWSRAEFLAELGWKDTKTFHRHRFPVGIAHQRNPSTERNLKRAIDEVESGYLSLVGPPGSGKSTLLQTAIGSSSDLAIVRYLAYLPGQGHGLGRAEAEYFLEDVIVGLRQTALPGVRFLRESQQHRREEFEALLEAAGTRFKETKVRTLILVDGLDHVPREERPERPFLSELPLPTSLPDGVIFLLGTQRMELPGLPPSVQQQACSAGRQVEMSPLPQSAISSMADKMGLSPCVSRSRIWRLGQGHPLATHYLIQALLKAESDSQRDEILRADFEYSGDIETYYESVIRGLADNDEVMDILSLLALSEAPLDFAALEGRFYTSDALNRAWSATSHLLRRSKDGLSVFHNSFRLFVARYPRSRFGAPVSDSVPSSYQRLAEIAESSGPESPQRFLWLRYTMRMGDHARVLKTATPAYFRKQYFDGRPISQVRDDIRLAFGSLKHVSNTKAAFDLILASDEMYRRASSFDFPDETIKALIALGKIEDAAALIDESGGDAYLVVDAWLDCGDVERARALFDRIDPLQELGPSARPDDIRSLVDDFEQWAARANSFRAPEEIVEGIERITKLLRTEKDQFIDPDRVGERLRWQAGLDLVLSDHTANVDQVVENFQIEADLRTNLELISIRQAFLRNDADDRSAAIRRMDTISAAQHHLDKAYRRVRRSVCLLAARSQAIESSRAMFSGLATPAISEADDSSEDEHTRHVTRAVIEHSELASWLDFPLPVSEASKHSLLVPLQRFAERAGALAAKSRMQPSAALALEVSKSCADLLRYMCRTEARSGGDHFQIRKLDIGCREVLSSLLASASRIGREPLRNAVETVDGVFVAHPTIGGRTYQFRMMLAEWLGRLDPGSSDAKRRLEELVEERDQHTPAEFLDSTARLARAFASSGHIVRGEELIAEQRSQTLGYALRAKKDPQYSFWIDLLCNANRIDPAGRAERVRSLVRQAHGMGSTEGYDAAARIAHELIVEATTYSAQLGSAVADHLLGADLISTPEIVDALMIGMIRRDGKLVRSCVDTWVALCLPFHHEVFYRPSGETQFIREAISQAHEEILGHVSDSLLENIQVHSQVGIRPNLVRALQSSLRQRGVEDQIVESTADEVASSTPLPKVHSGTPMRYDGAETMHELADMLSRDAESGAVNYDAASAFRKVLSTADTNEALQVFRLHEEIHGDNESRFALAERALDEGQRDIAESLVNEYKPETDRYFCWPWMWGGGKPRYFRVRLKLEGSEVHAHAYSNFASSLAAGENGTNSILWDVDSIWPIIDPEPDWPAMWSSVQEQLTHTRDYALGEDVCEVEELSDEGLTAKLLSLAIKLPVAQLKWHAGRGALALARSSETTFWVLLKSLLDGPSDSAITGLQLLQTSDIRQLPGYIADRIQERSTDTDYGTRLLAVKLLEQLGLETNRPLASLPAFYELALPPGDNLSNEKTLREHPTGPPLISDPLAWSAPFAELIERISECAGVSEQHIRFRVQHFIDSWGGVEAFGANGVATLRAELDRLGLRLNYMYPHVTSALNALRLVVGELDLAGRVDAGERESLLRGLFVPRAWTRHKVDSRPSFIARPTLPDSNSAATNASPDWEQQAALDLSIPEGCETILAEVTRYSGRSSFSTYEWSRMRLYGVELPHRTDPVIIFDQLPRSGLMVRPVVRHDLGLPPRFELTIHPRLLDQLGWHTSPLVDSSWVDATERPVARAYSWRDGGPDGRSHRDSLYGEGAAITLTEIGSQQLLKLVGPKKICTVARRSRSRGSEEHEYFAHDSNRESSDQLDR